MSNLIPLFALFGVSFLIITIALSLPYILDTIVRHQEKRLDRAIRENEIMQIAYEISLTRKYETIMKSKSEREEL